jgi:hypothetical protein
MMQIKKEWKNYRGKYLPEKKTEEEKTNRLDRKP